MRPDVSQRSDGSSRSWLPRLAVANCLVLGGCAYSYVDQDGDRHVIGLVSLEIVAADDATFAGRVTDLSTLGISFAENAGGRSFTIGYSREITGDLRNHALVLGDPLALATVAK